MAGLFAYFLRGHLKLKLAQTIVDLPEHAVTSCLIYFTRAKKLLHARVRSYLAVTQEIIDQDV